MHSKSTSAVSAPVLRVAISALRESKRVSEQRTVVRIRLWGDSPCPLVHMYTCPQRFTQSSRRISGVAVGCSLGAARRRG